MLPISWNFLLPRTLYTFNFDKLHTGRKNFICFMLSIGVAPQVVMKFTGHADYKSMKPYIDIAEKAKTDAMDAMEKALGE